MKLRLWLLAAALWLGLPLLAQKDSETMMKSRLAEYFLNYKFSAIRSTDPIKLDSVKVSVSEKTLRIYANEGFAAQSFTREGVQELRRNIARLLPPPYNTYQVQIFANRVLLEELVPAIAADSLASARRWNNIEYKGNAWVTPMSQQFTTQAGLQGRHISLWASHGKYFDLNNNLWKWQRPRLYCTTEDLFTQSIVVPFLMPMLENAGACVFSPRERDMQAHEVIVDNDHIQQPGIYSETNGNYPWQTMGVGFNRLSDAYFDQQNPFAAGTFRGTDAQTGKRQLSSIVWQPTLPDDGEYAVYVSYASLPHSVSDAQYVVRHRGVETRFRVNQKMGGGTWVYLGTFDFQAGNYNDNCVLLTNQSNYRGVITADAVRFGGGMGNVARSDSLHAPVRSSLSRYLECSRYSAQWYGMPYRIYGTKESQNDYGEDINARSLMTNYLAAGSCILPGDTGLCVPIEMSLAVHSDAGITTDGTPMGTLGIYTTGKYTATGEYEGALAEGLFPCGMSRLTSRDFCDMVMTQVDSDLRAQCGQWTRRQMYDRNYSETREPKMPSMILETLSHQNYTDLLMGHDPTFKFRLARAIYKGVLRFSASMHGQKMVSVQPLPVCDFVAQLDATGDSVRLSWSETPDPLEPTAHPLYYIMYAREGDGGYDNGTKVFADHVTLPIRRGQLMRYKVTAVNDGGQSMDSEELCAYSAPGFGKQVLIVNAFQRLAGPQPVNSGSKQGFDMDADPGVVFHRNPSFCGRQKVFEKGRQQGDSGHEYEGIVVAGNTFDYPARYAADLIAADAQLSISSCSRGAIEQQPEQIRTPQLLTLILGAQRNDGYSTNAQPCFSLGLMDFVSRCVAQRASLLVSGAYISEDALNPQQQAFLQSTLRCASAGMQWHTDSLSLVQGMGANLSLYTDLNEQSYCTRRTSILAPANGAFCVMSYPATGASAAIAYQAEGFGGMVYGFPLEMVREAEVRRGILAASLQFLFPKQ